MQRALMTGAAGSIGTFLRHSSAIVSSPRRPSRTMRIFSSAENFRRVALRISRTVLSALPRRRSFLSVIVSLLGVTMNRKVSLTQSPQSVP